MTAEVKLPATDALKLREVRPGLWNAIKTNVSSPYGFFDVSTVFARRKEEPRIVPPNTDNAPESVSHHS